MGSSHSTKSWVDITGVTVGALKAIQSASDTIPVPYIPLAAGILVKLVENMQVTHKNKEDLLQLAGDAAQLVLAITTEYQRQGNQKDWEGQDLKDAGSEVVDTLRGLNALVEERARRSRGRRFLTALTDKDDILRYRTQLKFAATKFQIRLQFEQRQDIQKMANDIMYNLREVRKDVKEMRRVVDEQKALRDLEKWVSSDAKHYSPQRKPFPMCDNGSRKRVIARLVRWCRAQDDAKVQGGDQESAGEQENKADREYEEDREGNVRDDADVLWLHALYGSGKSAIMQNLSDILDHQKVALGRPVLGGTFFFGRNKPNRNQAIFLIPTIAEQVARQYPEFRTNLLQAIDQDPTILEKFDMHAINLLAGPLSKCTTPLSDAQPLIILIDGLDECDKLAERSTYTAVEAQRDVLRAVCILSGSKLHLRIVIASRPERHIKHEFDGKLKAISTHISLQDHPWRSEGDRDVAQKIRDGFEKIRKATPDLGEDWPNEEDLERLIHTAGDQYLYAYTVLEFIGNEEFLPDERLATILVNDDVGRVTAFKPMDTLLCQILGTCPEEQQDSMLLILAALSQRMWPESVSSLTAFTGVRPDLVKKILQRLSGIVDSDVIHEEDVDPMWYWRVPERLGYTIHHISTKEFLWDATRSGAFNISPQHDARIKDISFTLFTRLLLGECPQVQCDVWFSFLYYLSRDHLFVEVLDSFLAGRGSEHAVFTLSSTQQRALYLVNGAVKEHHATVTCKDLLRPSTLHALTNSQPLQSILEAIYCFEFVYRTGLPLNAVASQFASFYETILLPFDYMFMFRGDGKRLFVYVSLPFDKFLKEEAKDHTPIGATYTSIWLRAITTAFSSLYPDKFTGAEITWFSQQHEQLGDAIFWWDYSAWDATLEGVTHPTEELRMLLERVVEILEIARRSADKPPANFVRLFEPKHGILNIQWWVRKLKQALEETESQEDDPLRKDITQLIEELDNKVKELVSRGLREGWIKRPKVGSSSGSVTEEE